MLKAEDRGNIIGMPVEKNDKAMGIPSSVVGKSLDALISLSVEEFLKGQDWETKEEKTFTLWQPGVQSGSQ